MAGRWCMTDMTLPEGWRWVTTPHLVNRGHVAGKMWWDADKGRPRLRVSIMSDHGAFVAVVDTVHVWRSKLGRGNPPRGQSSAPDWRWQHDRTIPALPADITAAATYVELELDNLTQGDD